MREREPAGRKVKRSRVERIILRTRVSFIISELFLMVMAVAVAIDQLFGLDWGYHWSDLLVVIAIGLGGCLVYALCEAIFLFFRLTHRYP